MSSHNDIEKDLHGPERQFAITSWAVKNRTTVIVLTILICIMGIRAYMVMPGSFNPCSLAQSMAIS